MLRSWVVDNDLTQQVADGETGFAVTQARMSKVFQVIAERHRGQSVAVVGHVASLTVALG